MHIVFEWLSNASVESVAGDEQSPIAFESNAIEGIGVRPTMFHFSLPEAIDGVLFEGAARLVVELAQFVGLGGKVEVQEDGDHFLVGENGR